MGRTLTSSLFTPSGESLRARRARRRAERHTARAADAADRARARQAAAAARAAQRAIRYLPAGGEKRPAALRSWRRFGVPAHRATSAQLGGAYPFLAEGGLGSDGVLVGADLLSGGSFCYDPWVLYAAGVITNPNLLLAGVIGVGKSALAKSLAVRSIAFGRRVYVPGDPKGEWTTVAHTLGGQAITLGPGLTARLNPLDAGTRPHDLTDHAWHSLVWTRRRDLLGVITATVLGRPLGPTEHTALDVALTAASQTAGTPTLPHVVDALLNPSAPHTRDADADAAVLREDGRQIGHALRRMVHGDLAGLFDGPSTVTVDPTLPMISLDLSRVRGNDHLLSLVMTCTSAWMEAALGDPNGGRRWVIYDEAWRIMRHPALIHRMQEQFKLSRAYGIANMIIMHRLSDLDAIGDASSETRALAAGLLADCSTRVIYRQETDQLTGTATALGLTTTQRDLLPTLATGQGLWRIGDRAWIVHHQWTPTEAHLFDTTSRMTGNSRELRNSEASPAGNSRLRDHV